MHFQEVSFVRDRFAQSVLAQLSRAQSGLSQCHALYKTLLQERRVGFHLAGESLPFSPPERWALRSEVGALPTQPTKVRSLQAFSIAVL
jgi:hypothetical protein